MRGTRRAPILFALAVGAIALLGGCGTGTQVHDTPAPLPTPRASLSAALAGTVRLVTDTLATAGYQVGPPVAPYRPSEPASLTEVPRTVLQLAGPDADQGYIVIYELPTSADAAARATDLAAYLGSGFGQTNFPLDAQFSVSQVGGTVVMTWWSHDRSSDPDHAEGGFDAVRSIGQPYPVVK
jgi:hypothetical protein